jgi:pyruvate/2-oxoglutarate/acetoin dehydrogenase E1 component
MFGGKAKVPMVLRAQEGAGRGNAAQHSQSLEAWFVHVPGLKVVTPSTPYDAKGLLKTAVRDDNPVVFLEHKRLYSVKGPGPDPDAVIPLGRARIARRGRDITVVSVGKGVPDALEAAEQLSEHHGIEAEVIDLRTLRPLDLETVLESVARTNRLLAVEEGPAVGGWASGLLGLLAEHGLHDLDDAWLLTTGELPIPYSPTLEDAFIPGAEAIAAAVRGRAGITTSHA